MKPTTNDRIRITLPNDVQTGHTGTIISGANETLLFRVLMDDQLDGYHEHRYLLACEFEVIRHAEKTLADRPKDS